MGLMAMFGNALNKRPDTAIPAIVATAKAGTTGKKSRNSANSSNEYPRKPGQIGGLQGVRFPKQGDDMGRDAGADEVSGCAGKSRNDRRSCAECQRYYAGRSRQRLTPIGGAAVFTLHRCGDFQQNEVKND